MLNKLRNKKNRYLSGPIVLLVLLLSLTLTVPAPLIADTVVSTDPVGEEAFYFPDENFDAKQFLVNIKNHPVAPVVFGAVVIGVACLVTWAPLFKVLRNNSDEVIKRQIAIAPNEATLGDILNNPVYTLGQRAKQKILTRQDKIAANEVKKALRRARLQQLLTKTNQTSWTENIPAVAKKSSTEANMQIALNTVGEKTNPLAIKSLTQEARLNALQASDSYTYWKNHVAQPHSDELVSALIFDLENSLRESVVKFRKFEASLPGKVVRWRLNKIQKKLSKLRETLKSAELSQMDQKAAIEVIKAYDNRRVRLLSEAKAIKKLFRL